MLQITEQLQDTAVSLNAVSRNPSHQSFIPIGHISLDSKNPEATNSGLEIPSYSVYWIKTFFVQHHWQSKGIGRAAMDEVEAMALDEPLSAKTLMLDTVEKGDQLREHFAKATYGNIPKVCRTDFPFLKLNSALCLHS
jgi:GNAT superfamily N-acetyltransferase